MSASGCPTGEEKEVLVSVVVDLDALEFLHPSIPGSGKTEFVLKITALRSTKPGKMSTRDLSGNYTASTMLTTLQS